MLSIVIPAYNEEHRLQKTLAEVDRWVRASGRDVEIIVADDGSTDRTVEVALDTPVSCKKTVVPHPSNTGKGTALKRGVAVSSGDFVLIVDADMPTPLECVSLLEQTIEAGADIAFGSRRAPGAVITRQQPLARRLAGRVFNLLARLLLDVEFLDTQCGFKLFKGNVARQLFPRCVAERFAIDAELAARARLAGYRVAEVGITWTHVDNSSVRLLRDSRDTFFELLKVWQALLQEKAKLRQEVEVCLGEKKFRVPVANGFWQRLTGLLARKDCLGMYFPRCNAIHTFFMAEPLDVVFFNREGKHLCTCKNVPKNSVLIVWKANSVLELKGGLLGGRDSN